MKLVLLGAPGAGKGTQAEFLSERLNIPVISTGNILRAAVRDGTPVGRKARELIDAGSLVPDTIILGIVAERLADDDCRSGYILDGVPRTAAQAELLLEHGIEIDHALCLRVPDAVIMKRMGGRRNCTNCGAVFHITANPPKTEGVCDFCGGRLTVREDDMPETVLHRLQVYHEETEPILAHFDRLGMLVTVDGTGELHEVSKRVFEALGL